MDKEKQKNLKIKIQEQFKLGRGSWNQIKINKRLYKIKLTNFAHKIILNK